MCLELRIPFFRFMIVCWLCSVRIIACVIRISHSKPTHKHIPVVVSVIVRYLMCIKDCACAFCVCEYLVECCISLYSNCCIMYMHMQTQYKQKTICFTFVLFAITLFVFIKCKRQTQIHFVLPTET